MPYLWSGQGVVSSATQCPFCRQLASCAADPREREAHFGESHQLALAASDLDVGIRRRVHGAAVVQPGTACVSGSRLKLILDNLEDRYVVLEAGDEGLTIRSKQVEFRVPLEDAGAFADIPEFEATSYYVVQARDLKG